MWGYVLLVVVLLVPMVLVQKISGKSKKRGCGRGCATCGNRYICHPQERPKE